MNEARKKNGVPPLDVHIIDLVADEESNQCSGSSVIKMSSTAERKKLLGTLIRPVVPSKCHQTQPYVIGLTGGTASGKSSICRRLQHLGAAVIDCDLLGHQAYLPGTRAHQEIVSTFGGKVLAEDKSVNRKALGAVVFADQSRLVQLNQIVWPEIMKLAKQEVSKFQEQGFEVCVLDAAVLLEAGWDEFVNEVWVAIIPEEEAVKRILSRDGISQQHAENRIKSQMSNQDRVAHANVVFCTLWETDYTQKQVEKAWVGLQKRLRPGKV